MLNWDSKYETGVPLVDTQHKTLFGKINDLEAIVNGPKPDLARLDGLINFLETYVVNHFKYEEQCMMRFKCPAHEKNKKAHQDFLTVWGNFKSAYKSQGPSKQLLINLHQVAVSWIKNHICSVDIGLRN